MSGASRLDQPLVEILDGMQGPKHEEESMDDNNRTARTNAIPTKTKVAGWWLLVVGGIAGIVAIIAPVFFAGFLPAHPDEAGAFAFYLRIIAGALFLLYVLPGIFALQEGKWGWKAASAILALEVAGTLASSMPGFPLSWWGLGLLGSYFAFVLLCPMPFLIPLALVLLDRISWKAVMPLLLLPVAFACIVAFVLIRPAADSHRYEPAGPQHQPATPQQSGGREALETEGDWLYAVWGSSSSDVFAVGQGGAIQHYDGSAWSRMDSGTSNDLHGVWGDSSSDVFAVGHGGTIQHYDGDAWKPMNSGTVSSLWCVWGNSSSDVFAVGAGGAILHYDGSAWKPMNSGTTDWLYGVWGSSSSDVFAVGEGGAIVHYDGSAWRAMSSGTPSFLWSVWGSSSSDVFVVGEGGAILHYDGSRWSAMSSGTASMLVDVWGSSSSDVFAVGAGGTILHYDGGQWRLMASGTTSYIHHVWGSSSSDVFAVGWTGPVLHYDGRVWSTMSSSPRG